jgi:hypothetical protein
MANVLTCGNWMDEDASKAAFDDLVGRTECFQVYPEVRGHYVQPRIGCDGKSFPQIDRLLVPTKRLIAAGWVHGPIGVEIKRSGMKLGHLLCQSLDYSRSVWHFKPGYHVMCEFVFVWPVEKQAGDIASIMAQNRVGTAWAGSNWAPLRFAVGEQIVLDFDESMCPRPREVKSGTKVGSR